MSDAASPFQLVLPARLASTRLPEKLLQRVAGKSVLQHTFEAASRARCADRGVVVAVDHPRMAEEVDAFGGRWIMTPVDCPSGTDRVALVADEIGDAEIFINVQSDEPEIDPDAIDAVANALASDATADVATAGTPIRSEGLLDDPNVVKIAMASCDPDQAGGAGQGRAVYFSRACVPFDRDGDFRQRLIDAEADSDANADSDEPAVFWHHLGLYAYRRAFLSWFAGSPPSLLERIEKLEQLRAIEAGKRILVAKVGPAKSGIDTPSDLAAFRARVES